MPLNCLGNEVESGCVTWSGPDVPTLGIRFGDSLDDVLVKIVSAMNTPTVVDDSGITTDNIVSKSTIRNTGSVQASQIIKRDFAYNLASAAGGATLLNWDLVPVIRQLPPGYDAVLVKVKITGKPTNSSNLIVDSRSPSANLIIATDRYPVSVDFSIRVTAPLGNIDMIKTVNLVNPSVTGSFRAVLDANDLNPQSGEILLTEHLNSIESQLHNLAIKQDSTPDLSTAVEGQKLAIEEIQSTVANPGTLTVPYTKDGANVSGEINALITDLYAQIKTLKDRDTNHQSELASLRNQIDSLS